MQLAEKRKTMLDELSIQTQHDAEEAQKNVKSLQDEHEVKLQQHVCGCSDLLIVCVCSLLFRS